MAQLPTVAEFSLFMGQPLSETDERANFLINEIWQSALEYMNTPDGMSATNMPYEVRTLILEVAAGAWDNSRQRSVAQGGDYRYEYKRGGIQFLPEDLVILDQYKKIDETLEAGFGIRSVKMSTGESLGGWYDAADRSTWYQYPGGGTYVDVNPLSIPTQWG